MNECEHKLTIKMHQLEGEKCLIYDNLCDDNPNCYYKKLQRVKEETEVQKMALNAAIEENARLKTQIENIEIKHKRYRECSMQLNNKYKTTIKEIKGTIKHFKTYFSEKELNKVKFSDITVIEEIISEVENANRT